jgi:TPR repeat protein
MPKDGMDIPNLQQEAESGSIVAQGVLGICYLYGREVEVDYKEAFRLLSVASEKGASRAIVSLALMVAEGLGVPKDVRAAIKLYKTVANFEIRAQLELGRIYSRGDGVPADAEAAREFYSMVAAQQAGVDDSSTAALVGCATFDEIEEAKAYLASTT